MPGPNGKLTPEEQAKIRAYLSGRHRMPCPVCGNRNFTLLDHLVQPVTLGADKGLMLGGIGYPQFRLLCTSCSYTFFFNAVASGILPAGDPEKKA
jgi:predicted nucleic-acid-binding Zn-ribbon protein